MKVVLFGATGMVGAGALIECLADPRVEAVLAVTRSSIGRHHPKLRDLVHKDFFNFDTVASQFVGCDACFFCLGVSSIGMSEAEYTHLTYDLTLAAARTMAAANPRMVFCYVSGVGTDSTERGRTMWARVKGKTAYTVLAPLYPVLRPLLRGTTTANFGRALIEVAAKGYPKRILHSADINALAESR